MLCAPRLEQYRKWQSGERWISVLSGGEFGGMAGTVNAPPPRFNTEMVESTFIDYVDEATVEVMGHMPRPRAGM